MREKLIFLTALLTFISMTGCVMTDSDSSAYETESKESKTDRYIETTRTGRYTIDADGNDEEMTGFTTTHDYVTGSLEHTLDDEPDPDIIATTTTTWFTTKSKPETSAKKKTTTKKAITKTTKETAFVNNKLHAPTESEKFKSKNKYKVTSDTTYLNLRFGPSKKYDVQLKIPDGATIYGTAKTITDNDGWIYVSYKGTAGWVMEKLLKAE